LNLTRRTSKNQTHLKMRIYAAGSVANLILAGICFALFFGISAFAMPRHSSQMVFR